MPDLLDTNVISEPRKPRPEPRVISYFERSKLEDLFISSVTIAEIRYGIAMAGSGSNLALLQDWLTGFVEPSFSGRTLAVSVAVLMRWRTLMEYGRKRGITYAQPDLLLAATALEHNLTFVTRNVKDFAGIPGMMLYNPWEDL